MSRSTATVSTDRIGAAAGVSFVVLMVVGVGTYPNLQPPYAEDAVRAAYVERAGTTAVSAVLQLLGIIPFLVFLTSLWRRLRGTDEAFATITLIGGIATSVVILVWQAVIVGALTAANEVEGVDARPILAIVTAMDQSVTLPLSIMSGAAGIAILRGRSLPSWLGWLGIVTAILGIVGVLAIAAVFTTEFGRALAAANPLALLLFLVWTIGASIAFIRSPHEVA